MNTNKLSIFLFNKILSKELFRYSYLNLIKNKNKFIDLNNIQFNIKDKVYLIDNNKFNFCLKNK